MNPAAFVIRHCQKLQRSLGKKNKRFQGWVADRNARREAIRRRCQDIEYDKIRKYWDDGHCFKSLTIGPSDPVAIARWHEIQRCSLPEDDEATIKQWIAQVRGYSMVTYDGLLSLAGQVRYCEETGLPGVYVETGCHRGGAAAVMAKACLHYGGKPRAVHVFDSFEGLPQPDAAKDTDEWIADEWKIPRELHEGKMIATGSLAGASEEDVRHIFGVLGFPQEHLHTHRGWFCDTLPVVAPQLGQIAILRLDGDLYASTWDALTHLYPLVVPGGIVIVDDYNVIGARNAVHDYLAKQPRRPYICRADGFVSYFVKPL